MRVADRVGVAEVAVEVADELQNMGIGTALARRLVERARANGFTLLTATTLWENKPARATATPRVLRPRKPRQRDRARVRAHAGERPLPAG